MENIFQVIPFLYPEAAGQALTLVRSFPEYNQLLVYSPDIPKENLGSSPVLKKELVRSGAKLFRQPVFKRSVYGYSHSLGALLKLFHLQPPSIVISHTGYTALICTSALKLYGITHFLRRKKKTIHLNFACHPERMETFMMKKLNSLSLNLADRVITASEINKNQLISGGVYGSKISVIPDESAADSYRDLINQKPT
ncbi:MAG: glycosyltransferase [Candidatus Wallbacteria bacterium]|nr:glycosyltransferase [Candidatus Wallbacteria bacterium]